MLDNHKLAAAKVIDHWTVVVLLGPEGYPYALSLSMEYNVTIRNRLSQMGGLSRSRSLDSCVCAFLHTVPLPTPASLKSYCLIGLRSEYVV